METDRQKAWPQFGVFHALIQVETRAGQVSKKQVQRCFAVFRGLFSGFYLPSKSHVLPYFKRFNSKHDNQRSDNVYLCLLSLGLSVEVDQWSKLNFATTKHVHSTVASKLFFVVESRGSDQRMYSCPCLFVCLFVCFAFSLLAGLSDCCSHQR